jgi:hypothetical protein
MDQCCPARNCPVGATTVESVILKVLPSAQIDERPDRSVPNSSMAQGIYGPLAYGVHATYHHTST